MKAGRPSARWCATAAAFSKARKLLVPVSRTRPRATRSSRARSVSSIGVVRSGRWSWKRSMRSVPKRRRLRLARGDDVGVGERARRRACRSRPWSRRSTSSRRPFTAAPRISSDCPSAYTSAVSMRFTPAASARSTIARASRSSTVVIGGMPEPNVIAPSESTETSSPLAPRRRRSTAQSAGAIAVASSAPSGPMHQAEPHRGVGGDGARAVGDRGAVEREAHARRAPRPRPGPGARRRSRPGRCSGPSCRAAIRTCSAITARSWRSAAR